MQNLDRTALNSLIVNRLSEISEQQGVVESGLHRFYEVRVQRGNIFNPYELPAADLLRERFLDVGRIWDIGAGVGELSLLLAVEGRSVVALDGDRRRVAAMADLASTIAQVDPAVERRLVIKHGRFPDAIQNEDVSNDLAICFCLTFTASDDAYDQFAKALTRFRGAIIDIACLFSREHDPDRWTIRAENLSTKYGFQYEHLYDYGSLNAGGRVGYFGRPTASL